MITAKYYCDGCKQTITRPEQGKKFKQRCETAKKVVTLKLVDNH